MEVQRDKELSQDELSLKEIVIIVKNNFNYLRQKKMLILAFIIAGAILGSIIALKNKAVYIATLTFALEDSGSSGGLGSALGLASSFGVDVGGSGGIFEGDNLTELFKSRSIIEKTLLSPIIVQEDTILLADLYVENRGWKEEIDKDSGISDFFTFNKNQTRNTFSRSKDSLLGVIYKELHTDHLEVGKEDKNVSIITINVNSTSELFAKYFAESLVENVSSFYKDTKSKKARTNMEILQKQTDSVRLELYKSISGVAIANDNTFNLNPALNVKRTTSVKKQVDVQANTAILSELVKQAELAKVNVRRETPLIQVIDSPILPLESKEIGLLKSIILGSFIGGFVIVFFLVATNYLKTTLSDVD